MAEREEKVKRVSHALAALEKQIAEQKARAEEGPLDGFDLSFNLELLKQKEK